jgi:hypothetical protein
MPQSRSCKPGSQKSVPTTECVVDLLPAMYHAVLGVSNGHKAYCQTVSQLWHGLKHPGHGPEQLP